MTVKTREKKMIFIFSSDHTGQYVFPHPFALESNPGCCQYDNIETVIIETVTIETVIVRVKRVWA